jgi:hypothetical protein
MFLKNEVMIKFYSYMDYKDVLNITNQKFETTMELVKASIEEAIQPMLKEAIQPMLKEAIQPMLEEEIQASIEEEIQPNIEIMDQTVDMISLDGFSFELTSNPIQISVIKDQSIYLPKLTKIEVLSYDPLLDRINLRLSQDHQFNLSSNDILQINNTIFNSLDFPFSIQSPSNLKVINFTAMSVDFSVNKGIVGIKFNL